MVGVTVSFGSAGAAPGRFWDQNHAWTAINRRYFWNTDRGTKLSNMLSPIPAFFVNVFCIMLLMILGCHNVVMYNHSTFVLGYLLLQGYDVSGHAYLLRVEGLLAGMVICMAIFYKNQKNRPYRRTFLDLFREFDLSSARNRWYIKLTFIVSSAMLVMSLLGLPRAMWAGIACMSVCLPFTDDCMGRQRKEAFLISLEALFCGIISGSSGIHVIRISA